MIATYDLSSTDGMSAISNAAEAHVTISGDKVTVRTGSDAPAVPIPPALSSRQFWLAIDDAGLTAVVNGLVSTQPNRVQIEIAHATEFRRDYPLLIAMAEACGKSSADLDAIFISGASL